MRVVLVHGFNVRDPQKTIGKLGSLFEAEGVHAYLFRYGWLGLLGVQWGNDNLAETLRCFCMAIAESGEPVVVIGHSNGCALIHRTAWLMNQYKDMRPAFTHAVYLSPALSRDAELAPPIRRCDVHYTGNDWAVRASRLWPSDWGDMGARGPSHDADGRYRAIAHTDDVKGHSDYFSDRASSHVRETIVLPLVHDYANGRA